VLPFANLSNDPDQQYFADGITEDLTTDLSRIRHMFVISRNTAFTYRNKPVDAKRVGGELGVRYVLEESASALWQLFWLRGRRPVERWAFNTRANDSVSRDLTNPLAFG
jgi:hypothetical protein